MAAIVPIYNFYVLLKIVGRPGWWLVWYFIPFANVVVGLIVLWELTKSFDKPAGWFFGLWLLWFIFFPMLGFGSSEYSGPYAATAHTSFDGLAVREGRGDPMNPPIRT